MNTLSLRMPEYLHKQVENIAAVEKISMNHFITLAVAEKISALTTEDFIKARAKRASKEKFLKALEEIPDVEPEEYDNSKKSKLFQ
jgi:hypothetical protein